MNDRVSLSRAWATPLWRRDTLLTVPASRRFVSYEPALGPIDFGDRNFDWLIAGGESAATPRVADVAWFRAARDWCVANGIPFFFKQWGGVPQAKGDGLDAVIDGQRWMLRPEFRPIVVKQMSMF